VPFTADEALDRLRAAHAQGRLAHAYLITGPAGSGTRELAEQLAGLILGVNEGALRQADAHVLEPESKSRRIRIEQVREMERELHLRSSLGGPKVGVVFDADRLVEQAANAFLKTLEEPPAQSHLLLVSSQPDQLLETILSRCIEVPLRAVVKPALTARQEALLEILQSTAQPGGTDLAGAFGLVQQFTRLLGEAKEAITDETDAALKKEEALYKQVGDSKGFEDREEYYKALVEARYRAERGGLIEVLEQWFADALRQQHGADALDHPGFAEATGALASALPTSQLLHRSAALAELRDHFTRNVQEQLALECAFLKAFAA
jgi:DNA polymerase-3 subunit delta'